MTFSSAKRYEKWEEEDRGAELFLLEICQFIDLLISDLFKKAGGGNSNVCQKQSN